MATCHLYKPAKNILLRSDFLGLIVIGQGNPQKAKNQRININSHGELR